MKLEVNGVKFFWFLHRFKNYRVFK